MSHGVKHRVSRGHLWGGGRGQSCLGWLPAFRSEQLFPSRLSEKPGSGDLYGTEWAYYSPGHHEGLWICAMCGSGKYWQGFPFARQVDSSRTLEWTTQERSKQFQEKEMVRSGLERRLSEAEQAQALAAQVGGLSPNPQDPGERLRVAAYTCSPCSVEGGDRRIPGTCWLQWETPSQSHTERWEGWDRTPDVPYWSLWMHLYTCHTHSHGGGGQYRQPQQRRNRKWKMETKVYFSQFWMLGNLKSGTHRFSICWRPHLLSKVLYFALCVPKW